MAPGALAENQTSLIGGRVHTGGSAQGGDPKATGSGTRTLSDDCKVYVRTERSGRRVMAGITAFLEHRLKLKVNANQSAVARPWAAEVSGLQCVVAQETEAENRAFASSAFRGENTPDAAPRVWPKLETSPRPTQPCTVAGCHTSDSRRNEECWRNSMAGSGAGYARCYGGNGGALSRERRN